MSSTKDWMTIFLVCFRGNSCSGMFSFLNGIPVPPLLCPPNNFPNKKIVGPIILCTDQTTSGVLNLAPYFKFYSEFQNAKQRISIYKIEKKKISCEIASLYSIQIAFLKVYSKFNLSFSKLSCLTVFPSKLLSIICTF